MVMPALSHFMHVFDRVTQTTNARFAVADVRIERDACASVHARDCSRRTRGGLLGVIASRNYKNLLPEREVGFVGYFALQFFRYTAAKTIIAILEPIYPILIIV